LIPGLLSQGIRQLPLEITQCRRVQGLQFRREDPDFDRTLVAQALVEKLVVIGADASFGRLWSEADLVTETPEAGLPAQIPHRHQAAPAHPLDLEGCRGQPTSRLKVSSRESQPEKRLSPAPSIAAIAELPGRSCPAPGKNWLSAP